MLGLRLALLIGLSALLIGPGCSKPEDTLIGTWTIDLNALGEDPQIKKLDGDAKKKALEIASKMMKEMSCEFAKGGALTMKFGKIKKSGTWKVKSSKGKLLTLATSLKEGDTDKNADIVVEIVSKNTIKLTPPDKQMLPFVRR